MERDQATEHLEVIRTLMERSALYRRALGPVMTLAGTLGILAAGAGWLLHFETPVVFTAYWLSVGALTAASAFLLVRQQALKHKEPFLTPPTRRVVHAGLPALLTGFIIAMVLLALETNRNGSNVLNPSEAGRDLTWLPLTWVVLYGCAMHAAGFFTPRGLRVFGWLFVLGGSMTFMAWAVFRFASLRPQQNGHLVMGIFFGLGHLAYGAYLAATERKNAA